jgi:hypothetical protein
LCKICYNKYFVACSQQCMNNKPCVKNCDNRFHDDIELDGGHMNWSDGMCGLKVGINKK